MGMRMELALRAAVGWSAAWNNEYDTTRHDNDSHDYVKSVDDSRCVVCCACVAGETLTVTAVRHSASL